MRVIYTSAHLDDAVLSCGGLIYDQGKEGIETEVWTFMFPENADHYMRRVEEDNIAVGMVGAKSIHFNFKDAFGRYNENGERLYVDVLSPIHPADESLIESIASVIDNNIKSDDVLMCPLSIGEHVDHKILRQACERLIYPIIYYTDFPYIEYVPEKLSLVNNGLIKYPQTISSEGVGVWTKAVRSYVSQDLYPTPEITSEKIVEYWLSINGIYLWKRQTTEQIFTKIYYQNLWKNEQSVSGPGSTLEETTDIRAYLPEMISSFGINNILDIPCGDFFWMRLVDLKIHYTGADIVVDLIKNNQINYMKPGREFVYADILNAVISNADLILCRDCLGHFSNRDALRAIENIKKSKCKYLLTTTFPEAESRDVPTGGWRAINLQAPPFNFPAPIESIIEHNPLTTYGPKHLALWRIKDLP